MILNIETATTVCSVSLSEKEKIIGYKEINNGYTHAENLHVYTEEIFKEAGVEMKQLKAVAVSKGPGSYTGLRIGVSAAKGFAFALNIPLISVDTLQIMSNAALSKTRGSGFFCPMIDARRMEVYTAVYDQRLDNIEEVRALVADEKSVQMFSPFQEIYFFGDGMLKCKPLLQQLPGARFIENIFPSSVHMPELSYKKFTEKKFEDTACFEPFYLKEFFTVSKKMSG